MSVANLSNNGALRCGYVYAGNGVYAKGSPLISGPIMGVNIDVWPSFAPLAGTGIDYVDISEYLPYFGSPVALAGDYAGALFAQLLVVYSTALPSTTPVPPNSGYAFLLLEYKKGTTWEVGGLLYIIDYSNPQNQRDGPAPGYWTTATVPSGTTEIRLAFQWNGLPATGNGTVAVSAILASPIVANVVPRPTPP